MKPKDTKRSKKKDIHNLGAQYDAALKKFSEEPFHIEENKKTILRYLRDCEIGETIKKGQTKKIGKPRCYRKLGILKNISKWLDKPYKDVTKEDMKDFIYDFEQDVIRQDNGNSYAESTKTTIKKEIRKFWKYLKGDCLHYPPEVEWVDTTEPQLEIPALTFEEVEKVVAAAGHTKTKALVALLFETGARIEEFLNIRLDDVEKKDKGYYTVRIRHETSKFRGRTVGVSIYQDLLQARLRQLKQKKENPCLFDMKYNTVLKLLHRLGEKSVGKRVHPHLLRHSAATYFASIVPTHQQFCYMFGWSMHSKMAQRYIDRAGINAEKISLASINNAVSKKKEEADKAVIENRMLKENLHKLRDRVERMESFTDTLVEYLKRSGQWEVVMGSR